jgi:hypothetical protein
MNLAHNTNRRRTRMGSSRDFGLAGNGKGDKNRSVSKAYRDGYDEINWGRKTQVGTPTTLP